jgi:phosphoglycerate dehydrogenase-like enzyme
MGDDLPGKILGIVGLGRSGAELVRLARPFGMHVLAYSPHANAAEARSMGVTLVARLDELLPQADFVSLHCRLAPDRHGMFGEQEFRLMKREAYFINVARGELVEQAVLVRALSERWIAGAGLDVFEHEPLPAGDPLLELENVILTPHWLPATRQAARLTMEAMARGMLQAAAGLEPDNVVNREVLHRPAFLAKLARYQVNCA